MTKKEEKLWNKLMAMTPELRRARYVQIRDKASKSYDLERELLLKAERIDDEAKTQANKYTTGRDEEETIGVAAYEKKQAELKSVSDNKKKVFFIVTIVVITLLAIFSFWGRETREQRCARQRIEELKRRTELEQKGVDTGSSDPLDTPCN